MLWVTGGAWRTESSELGEPAVHEAPCTASTPSQPPDPYPTCRLAWGTQPGAALAAASHPFRKAIRTHPCIAAPPPFLLASPRVACPARPCPAAALPAAAAAAAREQGQVGQLSQAHPAAGAAKVAEADVV